jgi:hypothetical protein
VANLYRAYAERVLEEFTRAQNGGTTELRPVDSSPSPYSRRLQSGQSDGHLVDKSASSGRASRGRAISIGSSKAGNLLSKVGLAKSKPAEVPTGYEPPPPPPPPPQPKASEIAAERLTKLKKDIKTSAAAQELSRRATQGKELARDTQERARTHARRARGTGESVLTRVWLRVALAAFTCKLGIANLPGRVAEGFTHATRGGKYRVHAE